MSRSGDFRGDNRRLLYSCACARGNYADRCALTYLLPEFCQLCEKAGYVVPRSIRYNIFLPWISSDCKTGFRDRWPILVRSFARSRSPDSSITDSGVRDYPRARTSYSTTPPGLWTSTYEQIIVYGRGLIPRCTTSAVKGRFLLIY